MEPFGEHFESLQEGTETTRIAALQKSISTLSSLQTSIPITLTVNLAFPQQKQIQMYRQ